MALTKRERGNCRSRVLADSGQCQQVVDPVGHLSAVIDDDGCRGGMQPQRATGIAQASPGPYGFTRA